MIRWMMTGRLTRARPPSRMGWMNDMTKASDEDSCIRDVGHDFFEQLSRHLHRADAAAIAAGALGQPSQFFFGRRTHRHFRMMNPSGIGWPSQALSLTGLQAGPKQLENLCQAGRAKRSAADLRNPSDDPGAELVGHDLNVASHHEPPVARAGTRFPSNPDR